MIAVPPVPLSRARGCQRRRPWARPRTAQALSWKPVSAVVAHPIDPVMVPGEPVKFDWTASRAGGAGPVRPSARAASDSQEGSVLHARVGSDGRLLGQSRSRRQTTRSKQARRRRRQSTLRSIRSGSPRSSPSSTTNAPPRPERFTQPTSHWRSECPPPASTSSLRPHR
jgi:hypothetical protein